ncbi:lysozyme [Mesorhizobium sp. M7D.F.Ca.US.005.01.1.1]|uniref:lysozyme n=1 Tax=Mesorhizobium sp. M7D.F.Ca.US.005.01.1.1 TaxID=2493678 RepID=UPI000F75A806|nr:lysozyme [Mesorhizobium sp. M7D.F.Ca.US.005.01.1.1]AZO45876.1 lysozyme [Mesorhizobium sp. M7D.F.Ca.US.005.01.1.1]
MQTSPAGRAAIARREGNVLKAYLDSVGVLTIGVGHTSSAGPPKVTKGLTITAAESDAILARDLAGVEASVSAMVKVPLNQNEFDALVSLVFNIGAGDFKGSSVLRNLNAGNRAGAADAMLAWNKGTVKGKKVALPGLTNRRQEERMQFLRLASPASPAPAKPTPVPQAPPPTPVAPEPPVVLPVAKSNDKTAATVGILVVIGGSIAALWHHITAFVGGFF